MSLVRLKGWVKRNHGPKNGGSPESGYVTRGSLFFSFLEGKFFLFLGHDPGTLDVRSIGVNH